MGEQPSVAVKYVGRRDSYRDQLYGTGLAFEKGQVRNLPADLARKFLRHGDTFEAAAKKAEELKKPEAKRPDDDTAKQLA